MILKKNKSRKLSMFISVIYGLLIFFSIGEDFSYTAAILTSIYAGLVVGVIVYAVISLLVLVIQLIK